MRDEVPVKQAQVCKLLPKVAGHFIDQRGLSVNDLIMREREHKIFREGIQHREGHPVVMILPIDRVHGEIA